jgi:methionyl-tRNA formyltransferase
LGDWARAAGVSVEADGDYRSLLRDGGRWDLAVSVFYDKIIRADFIARCARILNLHNGPLPRYRGVAPINWALKNGEEHHGVTIHEITPSVDAGPIVAQVRYSIYPDIDEVRDVYARGLAFGWTLFEQTMPIIDHITPREQNESEAVYYSASDAERLAERRRFTRAQSR